jgi:hypothetical protein
MGAAGSVHNEGDMPLRRSSVAKATGGRRSSTAVFKLWAHDFNEREASQAAEKAKRDDEIDGTVKFLDKLRASAMPAGFNDQKSFEQSVADAIQLIRSLKKVGALRILLFTNDLPRSFPRFRLQIHIKPENRVHGTQICMAFFPSAAMPTR